MIRLEQTSAPRLLIVDDNANIHRDFRLVLEGEPLDTDLEAEERRLYGGAARSGVLKPAYTVDSALSGLEGVEKVKQALAEDQPYQLAFVDIRMPGIDGVETIQRMWRLDARLQVVICTAFADYSWEDLIRRLGHTDKLLILKKPFDNIEVTLLASTLTKKWFLARQVALKLQQLELLVARRTQRMLDLQSREPAAAAPETAVAERAENGAPAPDPPVILLVTKREEMGRSVRQSLGAEFRVVEARDGQQGLREALDSVPDLVLVELGGGCADGIAFCRRLKNEELTSHIPVILLAAGEAEDLQRLALAAGADDCIAPGAKRPSLSGRVDQLLRARRQPPQQPDRELDLRPRDLAANQLDAQFLRRTLDTVERHLADYEFDVETLARALAVSRRQLFRKLKAVAGCTPNSLVRAMRLERAAQLLAESHLTVTEITYAVGFSDLKHFRTVFREHFGVLPGEYARKTPQEASAENEPGATAAPGKE